MSTRSPRHAQADPGGLGHEPLGRLETILIPLLRREDPRSRQAWARIDALMLAGLEMNGVSFLARHLGWRALKALMTWGARRGATLAELERRLRLILGRRGGRPRLYANSLKRAERSFASIEPHLVGSRVLDLGAGDGLLAQTIHERTGKEVILVDVVDYRLTSLPLLLHRQGERLALGDDAVDTTVLYGVLHHADDPRQLLQEAARVTRHRLVIKEKYVDDEESRLVGCFFDWWGNRAARARGVEVGVPANYRTTGEWRRIFASLGLAVASMEIPEASRLAGASPHVLFVLDRCQAKQS